MSFRFLSILTHRNDILIKMILKSLLVISYSVLTLFGLPQTVDRIVAVVNDRVITLTDIRIVKEFDLYEEEMKEANDLSPSFLLDRMIDQKLIIQLSGVEIDIEQQEVDDFLRMLREKFGNERFLEMLREFGLQRDDLSEYIHEKISCQKLLSQKFSKSVVVRLDEIESYYREIYIPAQKRKGLEPQPIVELLREIESKIIENKIQDRIEDWLNNLRKQGDIQIKIKDLDEYFKEKGSFHE